MNENTIRNEVDCPRMPGLSELLRDPGGFVRHVCECRQYVRLISFLILLTLGGFGIFGLVTGFFVDWRVALLDMVKMIGVVVFGFALCLPSLYVFMCISGVVLSFSRIVMAGLVVTAMMGCVMGALAPVIWLFSASTSSMGVFLLILLFAGSVAVGFGVLPIKRAYMAGVFKSCTALYSWLAILVVVMLQCITLMRPMLSPVGEDARPQGKQFFIQHFFKSLK
jgi:MFS family permease